MATYVGGAIASGLGIWALMGQLKAEEYFAGYLLEQSLSVDNLFVFILVFNYFKTPLEAQGKVCSASPHSQSTCDRREAPAVFDGSV